MKTGISESLHRDRQAMIDLTSDLIAIASENPPGNCYDDALERITRQLRQLGFESTRRGQCLLASVGDCDEHVLYFSGHYDVVPAQDTAQFKPAIKGTNLFGRGSSDMKSGLAAMIYAAKAVREAGRKLNGKIGLVFVPDEETAGPLGSRLLHAEGLLGKNGIGMLTPEPTGGVVWNANRGAITARITLRGKPAHVGRQFEGINAFERMLTVAARLASFKCEVERGATSFELQPQLARHSILLLGGQSGGGTNFNVVPEWCWFTVDRRINPEEDFETEKARLLSVIAEASREFGGAEVDVLQEGRSAGTPADAPLGTALAGNIKRVTGSFPRFELCPGLLETRFYAAQGIPAYAYGPGLLTVSHGPNEFVPLDNILACARVYALTALDILGATR